LTRPAIERQRYPSLASVGCPSLIVAGGADPTLARASEDYPLIVTGGADPTCDRASEDYLLVFTRRLDPRVRWMLGSSLIKAQGCPVNLSSTFGAESVRVPGPCDPGNPPARRRRGHGFPRSHGPAKGEIAGPELTSVSVPRSAPRAVRSTFRQPLAPEGVRVLVHAILAIRLPGPERAAWIPTVAWTSQRRDCRPTS
jgi:hypothetical protein